MESDNEPDNQDLPAWERESAQSPRVEEPDGSSNRSIIITAVVIIVLLVVLPFTVFSCGVIKQANEITNQVEDSPFPSPDEWAATVTRCLNRSHPAGMTEAQIDSACQKEADSQMVAK